MNILFLNDAPVVRFGLAAGFQTLGHEVHYLVLDAWSGPRSRVHLWELSRSEQLRAVDCWLDHRPRPDLFLYEGFTGTEPIHPEAILRLRARASAPFYYWAIEDPLWTHEVIDARGRPGPYAGVADHIFTTAIECVPRYRSAGIPSTLLRFACNPAFHRRVAPAAALTCDVVLVANYYPGRARWLREWLIQPTLEHCQRSGRIFHVYGHGWERDDRESLRHVPGLLRGPLRYEDLPTIYASTKIALGAEQCLNESDTQCSMRVFEALGCGACYLGPRHRAHSFLFVDREEVALTGSAEETLELLDWLFADDGRRETIARAGQLKCHAEHNYSVRARDVLEVFHAR
ncbi:MAG: CgeB family protein [Candidatus Rokuibacteriota bacterium]